MPIKPQVAAYVLLLAATCFAGPPDPHPLPVPAAQEEARRDAIHRELDQNRDIVNRLYELLEELPKDDQESRLLLEVQIQQYDDRSSILFDEIDALDQQRYVQDRQRDYVLRVQRLKDEAEQLRRAGRPLPAAAREAKARELQRSLKDGTWKIDVADEWNCTADQPSSELINLRRDFEILQKESEILHAEIVKLRAIVEKLQGDRVPGSEIQVRP